jgi:ABC-type transport system substrate-binding protein
MYWHDITSRADRHTPSGTPLLVGGAYDEKVMADDVIFSIYAIRDTPDSSYDQLVADVVSAEEIDPYTVRIYYRTHMPLWDLLWVGDIPIMPKHVWEPVFLEGNVLEFDPLSQECLSGSGPWIFDYANSSIHNYYSLHENIRYFRYRERAGDINGDFKVSLQDLVLLANAYGTTPASGGTPGTPHAWNPNADINGDFKVSLQDLVILAMHYGQHYP